MVGRFDDHHALLLRMHLDHVDQLGATSKPARREVDGLMAPFAEAATGCCHDPGCRQTHRRGHRRRDRRRHVPVPDRRTWRHGSGCARPPRVGRQTPLREGPQGQPGAAGRRCAKRPGRVRTARTTTWPPIRVAARSLTLGGEAGMAWKATGSAHRPQAAPRQVGRARRRDRHRDRQPPPAPAGDVRLAAPPPQAAARSVRAEENRLNT